MPQVFVLGVVGLPGNFQGDVVGFGVVDLLVPALDVPLPPGGDNLHLGGKALDGQLKPDLVVALAGAAVADGVGPLLFGNFNQPLGDDRTGEGGAQKVVLVLGPHHHGGDNHLVHHLVGEVLHIELGGAGFDGFFLQAVQLGALAHVAGDGDDLRVVVVLLQPGDDDGCIQAAGVRQHYFFYVCHDKYSSKIPGLGRSGPPPNSMGTSLSRIAGKCKCGF